MNTVNFWLLVTENSGSLWCQNKGLVCRIIFISNSCQNIIRSLVKQMCPGIYHIGTANHAIRSHYREKQKEAENTSSKLTSLQWCHNEHDGVSNHQPRDCLLNRLFRHRSKKTPRLRVTGLCEGNSPGTGEFPAQRDSNTENISIWWRHHILFYMVSYGVSIVKIWGYNWHRYK